MNSSGEFLEKHGRIMAVMAGVAVLFWIVYALRLVMFPFLTGLALVYITLPLVSWVERRFPRNPRWLGTRRVSAIVIVYLVIVLMLGVFFFFFVSAVTNSLHLLGEDSTRHFARASATLKRATDTLRQMVPQELRAQMDSYIHEMGITFLNSMHDSLMDAMRALPSSLGVILGFAGVPFFLFYVLKDREKLGGFYSGLPSWARPHARNILLIIGNVFGRYIRVSLLLGVVVGTLDLIGLLVLRVPMAPLLAVFAGLTEMVPLVGPWIGGIVAVMVTLALAPDKAIWVAALFVSVQLLENVVLVPRIQAAYFKIHPSVTIVLLTVGFYIAGAWGIMFALPVTASVVGAYRYCCRIEQGHSKPEDDPIAVAGLR